jgi:hypothetical protein
MDDDHAAGILRALAAGADPAGTGERLGDLAVLQHPDVGCALQLGAAALDARTRQQRRQSSLPRNAGKAWTQEEDERLLASFDGGATVEQLVAQHERTRAGIEARLVKHGRLDLEQAPAARIR